MKITNVEPFPVWDGRRDCLFVVVDTDEGISVSYTHLTLPTILRV